MPASDTDAACDSHLAEGWCLDPKLLRSAVANIGNIVVALTLTRRMLFGDRYRMAQLEGV